jgi:isocitrate lyase
MKYIDTIDRLMWEVKHRQRNPASTQNYYMSRDVKRRQEDMEARITQYQEQGRKLTKQMRSYLRSKNASVRN